MQFGSVSCFKKFGSVLALKKPNRIFRFKICSKPNRTEPITPLMGGAWFCKGSIEMVEQGQSKESRGGSLEVDPSCYSLVHLENKE